MLQLIRNVLWVGSLFCVLKMDAVLKSQCERWLRLDRNPATRGAVAALLSSASSGGADGPIRRSSEAALRSMFGSKLEFGTAGLRGRMGPGTARMNDVTVIQAAQGVAKYLTLRHRGATGPTATTSAPPPPSSRPPPAVVIGYDGRHNSQRFAELSANVFVDWGLKVYMFPSTTPTPFVPFAIRRLSLDAGIMVTASHNPKQDNGYKVYAANGAQIIAPIDSAIAEAIDQEADHIAESAWADASSWPAGKVVVLPSATVIEPYFDSLRRMHCAPLTPPVSSTPPPLRIVYTAMHGVGGPWTRRAVCDTLGFPSSHFFIVERQFLPDPEFSTVTFPNPEEGKESLDLALQHAKQTDSHLILANDPDADRLAAAERGGSASPDWKVFTGDELGALLGWWCFGRAKLSGIPPSRMVMLSSAVSSSFLATMARAEGFHHETTLTGFKWMGSRSAEILAANSSRNAADAREVIFAFEEAIGFMCGSRVLDKDGVTAAAVLAQLAVAVYARGSTLAATLSQLYERYGYHGTNNSYVVSPSPQTTVALFADLSDHHPSTVAGVRVADIRELVKRGTDSRNMKLNGGRATLPMSKASPMITYYFANGVTLTLRGSGTEPKIKWYSEVVAAPRSAAAGTNDASAGDGSSSSVVAHRKAALVEFVSRAVDELLQPTSRKLKPRASL